jgi:hypothetical protein
MKFINTFNNTEPVILHINGSNRHIIQQSNFYLPIIKTSPIEVPSDLTLITCATHTPDCYNKSPLIKQLNYNNVDFVNIGDNHDGKKNPWKNIFKLKYLNNFLLENNIQTEYICFLDAADILLSEDFKNILTKFKKLKKNLIWGSQMYNYPANHPSEITKPTTELEKQRLKYVNSFLCSGVCIGKTETFKEFIHITYNNIELDGNKWNSDQYEVRKTFNTYHNQLNVDYDYSSYLSLSPGMFWTGKNLLYTINGNNLVFQKQII